MKIEFCFGYTQKSGPGQLKGIDDLGPI